MNVYIINQETGRNKTYQIMVKENFGFSHVYRGKLFTLENAIQKCNENNFTIIKAGTIYQCI